MNSMYTEQICQLVSITKEKHQLLCSILQLTNRQSVVLNVEQIDDLMGIIAEKQKLIDDIDLLDESFDQVYAKVYEHLMASLKVSDLAGNTMYSELKDWVTRVNTTMSEISEVERKNSMEAGKVFIKAKDRVRSANSGLKGYSAYKKEIVPSDGTFFDQKK